MEPQKVASLQNKQTSNKIQQAQQPDQMTQQFATQLVDLLRDPKVEVKYGSLNAILQFTKSQSTKLLFLDTDLFKLVVESMKYPQIHKLCLSTLIHFSSSDPCAEKLIEYVQPIVMDLRNASGLPEQLGLLLLLNISKQFQFTDKLIPDQTQQKKQGQKQVDQQNSPSSILLQIIFSFMQSKPLRRWVIANIFVNLSSHEKGREYIAEQKLYLQFLKYINDEKESLRLAVLRIVRNVSFLWQKEQIVEELLKKQNHLIDHLGIHILILIIKSKLTEDWQKAVNLLKTSSYNNVLDYDMEIEPDLPKMVTTKQKSINQIEICVDIIILLSNSDFPKRKPQFCKDELKQVISIVNFTNISQGSKDKLEALETFCFW